MVTNLGSNDTPRILDLFFRVFHFRNLSLEVLLPDNTESLRRILLGHLFANPSIERKPVLITLEVNAILASSYSFLYLLINGKGRVGQAS
jgi:hypothetical protein